MDSMGTLHYNTVGTTFQVLDVISQDKYTTIVLIYNHIMREKQVRKIFGRRMSPGVVLTLKPQLINVEVSGINMNDAPDFVDAFIEYAEHVDGTPLTGAELEAIDSETIYEYVMKKLY